MAQPETHQNRQVLCTDIVWGFDFLTYLHASARVWRAQTHQQPVFLSVCPAASHCVHKVTVFGPVFATPSHISLSCPMCWRDAHSTPPSTTLVFLCFQPVASKSVFVKIIKSAFGYFRLLLQCYLAQLLCFDTRAATSKGRYRISPANIWNRLQSVFLKICYTCVFCTFPTGSTVSYPLEEKQYTPVIVLDLLVRQCIYLT